MHLRIARAAVVLAVFLSLPRCASPQESPRAGSKASVLDGTSWTLADLAGRPLADGDAPTARFEDGRVHGSDGCNRYSAPVTTNGDSITIGPHGPSTMMACSPAIMRQADEFMAALLASHRFRVAGERLELLDARGAIAATLVAQSWSLAGTSWRVTGINNGRDAVVGVHSEGSVTMTFANDGTVSGRGGCNRYSATYRHEGASLRFTSPAATRRLCPEEGIMEQERAFLAAMEKVSTLSLDGPRLDLRMPDGALALMLVRTSQEASEKGGD